MNRTHAHRHWPGPVHDLSRRDRERGAARHPAQFRGGEPCRVVVASCSRNGGLHHVGGDARRSTAGTDRCFVVPRWDHHAGWRPQSAVLTTAPGAPAGLNCGGRQRNLIALVSAAFQAKEGARHRDLDRHREHRYDDGPDTGRSAGGPVGFGAASSGNLPMGALVSSLTLVATSSRVTSGHAADLSGRCCSSLPLRCPGVCRSSGPRSAGRPDRVITGRRRRLRPDSSGAGRRSSNPMDRPCSRHSRPGHRDHLHGVLLVIWMLLICTQFTERARRCPERDRPDDPSVQLRPWPSCALVGHLVGRIGRVPHPGRAVHVDKMLLILIISEHRSSALVLVGLGLCGSGVALCRRVHRPNRADRGPRRATRPASWCSASARRSGSRFWAPSLAAWLSATRAVWARGARPGQRHVLAKIIIDVPIASACGSPALSIATRRDAEGGFKRHFGWRYNHQHWLSCFSPGAVVSGDVHTWAAA